MRRSSTLGSVQLSRSIPAAFLFGVLSVAGFGCAKEGAPAGESPAVKEEVPGVTERAAATGAPAANQAAPADPGAAKEAAAPEGAASKEAAAAKGGDPSKAVVGAKQAEGQGAVAKEAAPAAEPSAAAAAPAEAAAVAAAPAETTAPTVVSPKVGDTNFSVWMQSGGKHKAGQQGVVEVVLIPKNGFHCNENYPYKIKLSDPSAGVSYPQPIVRKESMSVSADRGVMRVPFVASAAGDAKIAGKFSFSVCSSDQCLIDSRDVAITVKVD